MRKSRPPLYKWRHFEPAVITCAVGWYLRFSLSYRNVEALLTERGLPADHTTIWRWVQCYAPELNRRCRRELKPLRNGVRSPDIRRVFLPYGLAAISKAHQAAGHESPCAMKHAVVKEVLDGIKRTNGT